MQLKKKRRKERRREEKKNDLLLSFVWWSNDDATFLYVAVISKLMVVSAFKMVDLQGVGMLTVR